MTRFNNKYPYTDFHELNADWLLETVEDAAVEAKEAADTVATYNDRLTTVESDLTPIKSAMPGLASDVSDLQHDVGIMDSLITNTINPGLDTLQNEVEAASTGLLDRMTAAEGSITTLQNEVETPSTGLLARVTALENAPAVGGVTKYLRFSSGGTPFDYDARITYSYLVSLIGTTASVDMPVNIILVEDDEVGNTWYYTLDEGRYQVSAGTPRGGFAFTCRKPVLNNNNVVVGYDVCTVNVDKNSATPTYTEVYEAVLPAVTSADDGKTLAVDASGNWALANGSGVKHEMTVNGSLFEKLDGYYIDCGEYFIVRFKVRALASITTNNTIFTDGPVVSVAPYILGLNLGGNTIHKMYVSTSNPGYINSFDSAASGDVIDCTAVVVK